MSIRDDLKAFIDGELDEARAAEVREAVATDPALRQEVDQMRALGFEIKRLASEPAPLGAEIVLTRVRSRRFAWRRLISVVAGGALVLVAVSILFPVYGQSKEAAKASASRVINKGSQDLYRQPKGLESAGEDMIFGQRNGSAVAPQAQSSESKGGLDSPAHHRRFGDGLTPNNTEYNSDPYTEGLGSGFQTGQANTPGKKGLGGTVQYGGSSGPAFYPDFSKNTARGKENEKQAQLLKQSKETRARTMLIRTSDIDIKVGDARKTLDDAQKLATRLGGFASNSGTTGGKGSLPEANITLRVPVGKFDEAMSKLRAMGDVQSDNTKSDDVTAEYADTTARIKVMRAEEESYVAMLKAARKVNDLLDIKDRLGNVRQEIESLQAQAAALKDQSAMSTINASFHEKERAGEPVAQTTSWAQDTWAGSVNGLVGIFQSLGQCAIVSFVYIPIWLPILLVGFVGFRRLARPVG